MNRFLKVLVIGLIFSFLVFATNCFAVNIEMNLTSNSVDSNISTTYNSIDNNVNSNMNNNITSSVTNNISDDNSNVGTSSNTQSSSSSSLSDTALSAESSSTNKNQSVADTLQSLPESELGLTNVLNILLITVGVVLILLSIAIFIRLKK